MARDYRGAEVGGSLAGSASGASLGESSGPKHSLAAHIALYSLCFIYIFVFVCLSVLVILGTQTFLCFWCVSFVVLCICIFFIESASRNPVDPKIPLLLLVRSIQQSLKALTWSAQIRFEIYCNPKAAFRLNDVGTKSSIYHNWPTMSTPKLPGISFTLLYSVVRRSSKSRIEILWMLEI